MPLLRRLATLAAAGEAARRYAKKNPDQAAKYLDQAASFIDKQTKGKYSSQISGVTQKAKSAAGLRRGPIVDGRATSAPVTPTVPTQPTAAPSPSTQPTSQPYPGTR